MPRPSQQIVRTNICVPADVWDKLQLYIHDPVTGRATYGAMSAIASSLFTTLVAELDNPKNDPVELLQHMGVRIERNLPPRRKDND